jgi:hypothetical protein
MVTMGFRGRVVYANMGVAVGIVYIYERLKMLRNG